jgi:cytochrome c553
MAGKCVALLLGLSLGLGVSGFALADAETTATTVCVACHGANGNAPIMPNYPRLAGLQAEYLVKQLNDFISGKRKNDIMAPMAQQIAPEEIRGIAEYFSKQKSSPGATTNRVAASTGKVLYNEGNEESGVPACIGCHQAKGAGYVGSGGTYPKIGSQQADYIKEQLQNFASGGRANDPSRYMRTTAKRMTAEEIEEVAQYLSDVAE